MKPLTAISIMLLLGITGYLIGLIGDAFLFIIFLPFALVVVFSTIIVSAIDLIWRVFPRSRRKNYKKGHVQFIVLACSVFFLMGGWAINEFFLFDKFHPMSLLIDMAFLIVTIILGWSLLNSKKKGIFFQV